MEETVLEPELPIVDAHHHLWHHPGPPPAPSGHPFQLVSARVPRYLSEELATDAGSGHNVRASVYVQGGGMYRADGPEHLRFVGETEFANGIAAMGASGLYGDFRPCAGIVGKVDLRIGDQVAEVLEAHIAAGGGRFRGVRQSSSWDADPEVMGPNILAPAELLLDDDFRRGFAKLAPLGLSFDAWLLEPQMAELLSLAQAFPETTIVLDHMGTPPGLGRYRGSHEERFPVWREQLRALAALPNVIVKLGGLGMAYAGLPSFKAVPPFSSEQLAAEWRPYIEESIDAFGPQRAMFESNFPPDSEAGSYRTVWNAFKRLASGFTPDEKTALFSGTASRVYRLHY